MSAMETAPDGKKANDESPPLDEDYRIWKKNAPFLYDCVLTHALEWPSLTVQWLPDVRRPADRDVSEHKLILGTQSGDQEPNYLMIAEASLPNEDVHIDPRKYDDEKKEVGGYGGTLSKIGIKVKINHEDDVHRARYMPQNSFMIATKSPQSAVLVFDYSKHSSMPTDTICRPQHRCHGHISGGYGMSWNPHTTGHLLSASSDGSVCIWDIKEAAVDVQALRTYSGHEGSVEDVDWSKHHSTIFASVGADSQVLIWDTRDPSNSKAAKVIANAHIGSDARDINCVSFNPLNEFTLATGGSDHLVNVWDLRNLSGQADTLKGHTEGVYQLAWAPFDEYILSSSSEDHRVNIWDTSRIGLQQDAQAEDKGLGPPELLFTHNGHTSKVFDISWNANDSWYVASVAEDNVLQVWRPAESIYNEHWDTPQAPASAQEPIVIDDDESER